MTDYFGQVFTYLYNDNDYLKQVDALGKTVFYVRNPTGTIDSKRIGDFYHQYIYDQLLQIQCVNLGTIKREIQTFAYTYDLNGNQLTKYRKKGSSTATETYTYDALNRVKTVSTGGSTTTYSYDKNGNILSESTASGENTAVASYTYDANNRLTHKSAGTSFWDFSYDHDGNLIYKVQGTTVPEEGQETPAIFVLGTDTAEAFGDTATYQYNELGQLVSYRDLKGQSVTYTYDLNGLRSSKTVNGVTTKYYYDGDLVVNETDGTNLTATNLNGVQTEIRFTHEGETVTAAYFLYDGHGDVVGVLNETLDEIANYEYDIYGEEKSSTGTYDSPIRYTGQYYDAETGMYYLRARFYDPAIRRFISEDPAHDGRNWYAYCNGNPIGFMDSSGLFSRPALEQLLNAQLNYATSSDPEYTHWLGNDARNALKNNAQFLEGWAEGSELHQLIEIITSESSYASGNSLDVTRRALELTDQFWNDYDNRNFMEDVAFVAGGTVVLLPLTKFSVSAVSSLMTSSSVNFSYAAASHMLEKSRYVPVTLLQEAIKRGAACPDPRHSSNATMYYIEMFKNGASYTLEVLYDEVTNTILHFKYFR